MITLRRDWAAAGETRKIAMIAIETADKLVFRRMATRAPERGSKLFG
jgi:hypothetical protein